MSYNIDYDDDTVNVDGVSDWNRVLEIYTLSEKFLYKYGNLIGDAWNTASAYQKVTSKLILKFHEHMNWEYISRYQSLEESIIEEFKDHVNWDGISRYQILSENFIRRFSDRLNLKVISKLYGNLSEEIIKDLNLDTSDNIRIRGTDYKKSMIGPSLDNREFITCYMDHDIRLSDIFNNQIRIGLNKYDNIPQGIKLCRNSIGNTIKCNVYYEDIIDITSLSIYASSVIVPMDRYNLKLVNRSNKSLFMNLYISSNYERE